MKLHVFCTDDNVKEYPLHMHNYWEIMYYFEGEGYLKSSNGNFSFYPGTAIIIPPGISHGSVSEHGFKNISIGGDFEHLFMFDTPKSVVDNQECDGKQLAFIIYRNRYGNNKYLSDLCTAYIRFLLQSIRLENDAASAVNAVCNEIIENAFDSRINVTEILNKQAYAEDYIRMYFKKTVGLSPLKFLAKIRIDHACSLLDIYKNNVPLSYIAEQCGFTDYIFFSKKFKLLTGMSPKQYIISNIKK